MTRRFYRVTGYVAVTTPFSMLVEAGHSEHAFNLVQNGDTQPEPENMTTDEATRNLVVEFVDLESEE